MDKAPNRDRSLERQRAWQFLRLAALDERQRFVTFGSIFNDLVHAPPAVRHVIFELVFFAARLTCEVTKTDFDAMGVDDQVFIAACLFERVCAQTVGDWNSLASQDSELSEDQRRISALLAQALRGSDDSLES